MTYTAIAGFLSLIVIFPLVWVIATSLKDRRQIIQNPLGLPEVYYWSNFADAWRDGNFGAYFINRFLVVIPTALGVVVLSLLAAYAFAVFQFRGKNALFTFFLIGLTAPLGILVIPIFYQMASLKLVNNLWALILPQTAVGLPLAILLLRGFIRELPKEVLDAGRNDGCSNWGILRYIVLPLSRPAWLVRDDLQYCLGLEPVPAAGCAEPEGFRPHHAAGPQRIHGTVRGGFRLADGGRDHYLYSGGYRLCYLPAPIHQRYSRRRAERHLKDVTR